MWAREVSGIQSGEDGAPRRGVDTPAEVPRRVSECPALSTGLLLAVALLSLTSGPDTVPDTRGFTADILIHSTSGPLLLGAGLTSVRTSRGPWEAPDRSSVPRESRQHSSCEHSCFLWR